MAIGAEAVRYHAIATPEGVALPLAVAGLGDRLAAFLLDFGVVIAGTVIVWLFALLAAAFDAGTLGIMAALVTTFLLRNFYFVACEANWGGQTLGKRALKLRVVARAGGPLSAEAVAARNLMRELELFLPLSLLVGAATAEEGPLLLLSSLWIFAFASLPFWNRDRLRCGDLLAGTLVVELPVPVLLPDLAVEPPTLRPPPPVHAGPLSILPAPPPLPPVPVGAGPDFTSEQLDHYGIRELQVLEDLLRRHEAGALSGPVLEDVARRIQKKIGWSGGAAEPLAFLESFYRAQRARLEQKLLFGQRQERKKTP